MCKGSYLIVSNGFFKPAASGFLFAFDEKYQIEVKSTPPQELGCRACNGQNRAFVIGDPATIQVAIASGHGERV